MAEMTLGDFRDRTDGLPDSTILRVDVGTARPGSVLVVARNVDTAVHARGYLYVKGTDSANVEPVGVSDYADGIVRIEL